MPKFESFEEADAWRAANVGRPRGAGSDARQEERARADGVALCDSKISIDALLNNLMGEWQGREFESVMLEQSERVPKMAYAVYVLAVESGSPTAIEKALKNWSEAAKQARICRNDYLELQKKTRMLLHLDEVRNVTGGVFQEVRRRFDSLGDVCGPGANPGNPELAKDVINAEVDNVYRGFKEGQGRVESELFVSGGEDG